MSRHSDFLDDPAFKRAADGARAALALVAAHHSEDPGAAGELVAMCVLTAFTNADGLTEPHVGILARFAPDLGQGTGARIDDH
ncbi:hypothetical protein MKK69_20410 [Methylobacterium sp. J-026]|uniref:hypothetical protein n=1 Tax=Methylobacterium sp. J-026 TaxID=2836624 RepID=UPI001FB8A083|nr:hypothetical protein [Methylobacterium sp. J-026]MCJ2136383.1 hypothetical protein [Methylobacterium sp. J-026]